MKKYVLILFVGLMLPAWCEGKSVWRSQVGTELTAEVVAVDWEEIVLLTDEGQHLKVPVEALLSEDAERARALFKKENPLCLVKMGLPLFDFFLIFDWFEPAAKTLAWQPTFKVLNESKGDPFHEEFHPLKSSDLEGIAPDSKRRFLLIEIPARELAGHKNSQLMIDRLLAIQKNCDEQNFIPLILDPYYAAKEYGASGRQISTTNLAKYQKVMRSQLEGWKVVPVRPVVDAMIESNEEGQKFAKNKNNLSLLIFGVLFSTLTDEALPLDQWTPYAPHTSNPFPSKSILDGKKDAELRALGEQILKLTREHTKSE